MVVEEKVDKMKRKRNRPKLTKLTIEKQTTQPKEVRRGKIQYTPRSKKRFYIPRGSSTNGQHTFKIPHTNKIFDYSDTKVVIFCHIYYTDLITEIFNHINDLKCKKEVWVSLPDYSTKENLELRKKLILNEFPDVKIRVVPNKGKDIGGKLICLKEYLDNSEENLNDWLIFCHDKKSPHLKSGNGWRKRLLEGIFKPSYVMDALATKDKFEMWGEVKEGKCNSVQLMSDPKNLEYAEKLAGKFGLMHIRPTGAFAVGTMFWVKDNIYRNLLKNVNIKEIANLLEPGNIHQPSFTHAVERLLGLIITSTGKKIGNIR
tara:strand:+ start:111 stop:1058 length:948 start_codon:yes stop_codon:yes gene_type:complete